MIGLSRIGGGYSRPESLYPTNWKTSQGTPPSQEVKTPVPPVAKTLPVSRDLPVVQEPGQVRTGKEAVEGYREGADAAEMAVRGRIQYLSPEELNQQVALARGEGQSQNQPLQNGEAPPSPQEVMDEGECQTCARRSYQDGSDDPGVSFKTPTQLTPDQAATAVRGHEMEHVVREQAAAQREGREVVSQSVTYRNAICPECGEVYLSGGTTTTTTRKAQEDVQAAAQMQTPWMGGPFQAIA